MNYLKTFLLMVGLMALFLFIGRAMGGRAGMEYAFVLACAMNLFSYWFSDKMVLAMYGAKQVPETDDTGLVRIARRLAHKANIPMPRVYLIDSPVPNAFATGRNPQHAAIAATTGIIDMLNEHELEGVLGHELSHVIHRDILISTVAATLAGAIMMLRQLAWWGAMFGGGRDREERGGGLELLIVMIVAPLAATLIQLAISRSREYDADKGGALLTGDPLSLASALSKISAGNAHARVPLSTNPATAHLFICNPLKGEGLMALFSTHPPTAERIKRLEAMATGATSSYKTPQVIY
jgi:heat shock protein HtpX